MSPAGEKDFAAQSVNERADADPRNTLRLVLLAERDGQKVSRITLVIVTSFDLHVLWFGDHSAFGGKFLQDNADLCGGDFRCRGDHALKVRCNPARFKAQNS